MTALLRSFLPGTSPSLLHWRNCTQSGQSAWSEIQVCRLPSGMGPVPFPSNCISGPMAAMMAGSVEAMAIVSRDIGMHAIHAGKSERNLWI